MSQITQRAGRQPGTSATTETTETTETTATTGAHSAAIGTLTRAAPTTAAGARGWDWRALRRRLWPESGAVSQIPALDGLRALAVVLTMLSHAWDHIPGYIQPNQNPLRYPINYGTTGVQLFFVLSGFLLFLPYARWLFGLQARPSTRLFYKRRALRVGPAYWASLVILLLLSGAFTIEALGDLVVHAAFLQNAWIGSVYTMNVVFWTMAVEVQFYALLPAIAWLTERLGRRFGPLTGTALMVVALLGSSLVSGLLGRKYSGATWFTMALFGKTSVFFWLGVFGLGIACAVAYVYLTRVVRLRAEHLPRLRLVATGVFWAGVALGVGLIALATRHPLPVLNVPFGFVYAGVLFGVLFGAPWLPGIFASRPLRFIGLISYSLYIWHTVVLNAIEPHLAGVHPLPLRVAVGFALDAVFAIPAAYVSYQLTERPFFAARKKAHEAGPRTGERGAPTPERPAVTLPPEQAVAWAGALAALPARTRALAGRILRDRWLLAALGIGLVAFALRAVGADIGLPYHYHWDEPTIVNRAIRMASGDLNPHFFYYPGLSFYVTLLIEGGLYMVGHLLHAYPSVNAFAAAYFTQSTPFYLSGRLAGGLAGAATVVACYLVGVRFFDRRVALLAAGVLAVSPVAVANGHFITNDVPMGLFAVLTYLWLWDVYARGQRRDYVLAGVLIGLGIATKYLPAVLLVSLGLAHLFRLRREAGVWRFKRLADLDLRPLVWGCGVALLTFLLASPYSLLDWRNAIHDYIAQGQLSSAAGAGNVPLNFVPYLTRELGWSAGWPAYLAALLALVGIVRAQGERRRQLLLLASFPLLYFLMIGSARQPWGRWLVTLQPFLALGAAACAVWAAGQAPALWRRLQPAARVTGVTRVSDAMLRTAALALFALALVLPAAWTSVQYDAYLTRPDPRTEALAWFQAHVPASATVAVQPMFDRYFYNAPLMTASQLKTLEGNIPASKPAVLQAVDEYYRAQGVYPDVPFVYDLKTLRTEGVRYVVISSAEYHTSGDIAAEDRFYADLAQQAQSIVRFAPRMNLADPDLYPVAMPVITIYVLPPLVA